MYRDRMPWGATVLALAVAACGGAVTIGGGGVGAGVGMETARDAYRAEIDEWHRGRIERLTKEDGYLSLVGLHPLQEGANRFGSGADNDLVFPEKAPALAGTLFVEKGSVRLEVADAVRVTHEGAEVRELEMRSDRDGREPTQVEMGSLVFYVIDRAGGLYVRVKDPESPVRAGFHGIERFSVDRKWRLDARLDPYDPPKKIRIPDILGHEEIADCRGVLVFEIAGKTYRLEPMSEEDGEMFIVFGDATNEIETYGGGRFVYVPSPGPDGKTAVDFNKAYNPPCVFTPYATCPLPHRDNVLPIRIEAGEKMWGEGHH